jgi:hypothetical protein
MALQHAHPIRRRYINPGTALKPAIFLPLGGMAEAMLFQNRIMKQLLF